MSKALMEIAQELRDANKKVQLIYAFNATGKTRLSREFKQLIALENDEAFKQRGFMLSKLVTIYIATNFNFDSGVRPAVDMQRNREALRKKTTRSRLRD